MATEIERKFLVAGQGWQVLCSASHRIRQAYLARTDTVSVRVRIIDGARAFLTVKSAGAGPVRSQFEYAIPLPDAEELAALCQGHLIEKTRHTVPAGDGLSWEVDVFEGALQGLAIAEIELPDAQTPFDHPHWLGREVTGEARYDNAGLAAGSFAISL